MYKLCKTQESAQRQRQLELGLLEIMKIQHFDDISVSELCTRLNIPRKTFYRYFDSKEGALQGLIDHTIMDYEGFMVPYLQEGQRTLHRELQEFFCFWKAQRDLLDALKLSGLTGYLMERAVTFSLTDAVLPRRFLPEDSDDMRRAVTAFGVCGLLAMVFTWHISGFSRPVEELTKEACRILTKPMFPQAEQIL